LPGQHTKYGVTGSLDISIDVSGFTGTSPVLFTIIIDAEATPDTFKWNNSSRGATMVAATVAVTGAAQTLNNGVKITFDGTTGGDVDDEFQFTVFPGGTITASGIIKTDDTTAATSTTDGSLQTDGGLSVAADAVIGDDLILLSDAAVVAFGANKEITLTHVHNVGLTLTHVTAGDNLPVVLQLKSEEDVVVANEVIGSLEFAAGDSDGTDGATVAAGIHAIAEGTFSASANATKLVFTTGVSETAASSATAKMTLSSAGLLTIADDFMLKDGGTIGVASANDAMTISSAGIVTFKDDILIKDGGTIGSASDVDAIAIA
jgi:hypothetical protein